MSFNKWIKCLIDVDFFWKSKIKMVRCVLEEDLKNIEFEISEDVDVIFIFDYMGLWEDFFRGIYVYGLYNFICS